MTRWDRWGRRSQFRPGAAAVPSVLAGLAALAALGSGCSTDRSTEASFAFIADAPYGTAAMAAFPSIVASIDADTDVAFVAHAGDIRGGDTECSDEVLQRTFDLFQQFDDPFWYTPGDNEWSDCHRLGGFLPTERLDRVRSLFFAAPGITTGGSPMTVTSQASSPVSAHRAMVENTLFHRECVTFGAVHVVGSGDGAETWGSYPGDPARGLAAGDQPGARVDELTTRRAAAVEWIDRIFDEAVAVGSDGVFVMMQAEPVADDPEYAAVRERLLARAAAFAGPVMLGHGDQHMYVLTPAYGGVVNFTRLQAPGEKAAVDRWVKVTVTCGAAADTLFTLETILLDPPS